MKRFIFSLLAVATLAHAETTVTMTGVHNCCKSCTNGIVKAGTSVGKDITVTAEGKTVTITTKKKTDAKKAVEDFSVVVSYDEIEAKNYSFSAGQYFDVKVEYEDITAKEFSEKMEAYQSRLKSLFLDSRSLEADISSKLGGLKV